MSLFINLRKKLISLLAGYDISVLINTKVLGAVLHGDNVVKNCEFLNKLPGELLE